MLTVLVFLPIEYFTGYLQKSATYMEHMFEGIGGLKFASPLKVIVKPAVHAIKDVLGSVWGDHTFPIAISLLIIAFIILFVSLKYLVDILKSLLIGRIESMMSEVLFQNTIRALILGLILTSLVQSSSITTSLAVPLIGAGLLSLEKVFPYMVGANIGTTVTAIMASLVTKNPAAITVAFAHLLFNISGGLVFLPLRKIPIAMSEFMGRFACEHRYLAIAYIIVFFYVIPISVIVLSRTF